MSMRYIYTAFASHYHHLKTTSLKQQLKEVHTKHWLICAALEPHSPRGRLNQEVTNQFIGRVTGLAGHIGWWCGHLQGKTKSSRERVGVSNNKCAWCFVPQHGDGWKMEKNVQMGGYLHDSLPYSY